MIFLRMLPWLMVPCILSSAVLAVEKGTYLEQELVTQVGTGQPKMNGTQRIWFTSKHIRNEVSYGDETSTAIIDLAAGRIVLIPTEEKQYIEMKLKDYQAVVAMQLGGLGLTTPGKKPKLTPTGEQKKIGDWQCTRYLFEQEGQVHIKSELWVAKESGINFAQYLKLLEKLGMRRMAGQLAEFVSEINGYPIEVSTEQHHHGQISVSTSRVVKIVTGPVDPALFQVPKGYQRIEDKVLPRAK